MGTTVRFAALGLGAVPVPRVYAQKDELAWLRQQCEVEKHLAPVLCLDLTIFQGFVHAGPHPFKKR
jgi:hypothetical protein